MSPLDERIEWRRTLEETAPGATDRHLGTEPSDPPTLPPPPVTKSAQPAAGEAWWKRYGWTVGAFVGIAGVFGLGYGVAKSQATVTAEGVKPILDRLKAIEDEQKSQGLTIKGVATDVDWLKRTMAQTPGVSDNLNKAAHEPPRK